MLNDISNFETGLMLIPDSFNLFVKAFVEIVSVRVRENDSLKVFGVQYRLNRFFIESN